MAEESQPRANAQWWQSCMSSTLRESPLYTHLFGHLSEDQDMLEFLSLVRTDQPAPVFFFSVVTFLLQSELEHPLASFYPYFHPDPQPAEQAYPAFRDFCLKHRETLRHILPTARLQTNEVTRCANFVPVFEMVFQRGGSRPLAMVEIGSSAGLHLNWDRYSYRYGQSFVGDDSSPVQIECTLTGEHSPLLPSTLPPIASRQGIDIAPLDVFNEEHVHWLRACIWPEEAYRYRLLDAALVLAREYPPLVHKGDARAVLPEILNGLPLEQTPCIWHSYVLSQCPPEVREGIDQELLKHSARRTIYRISLEFLPAEGQRYLPQLELFTYRHGERAQELLAQCTVHGNKMEWLQPSVQLAPNA